MGTLECSTDSECFTYWLLLVFIKRAGVFGASQLFFVRYSSVTTQATLRHWNGSFVWQFSIVYLLFLRMISGLPVKDRYVEISSSRVLWGCYFQKWIYTLPELWMVKEGSLQWKNLWATWLDIHASFKGSQSLKNSLAGSHVRHKVLEIMENLVLRIKKNFMGWRVFLKGIMKSVWEC